MELTTVPSEDLLDAAARLPAASDAVPAAIAIFSVPSPEQPVTLTVRVVVPLPETLMAQPAVAVPPRVTSEAASVTFDAPE